jgi:hypothetical protein
VPGCLNCSQSQNDESQSKALDEKSKNIQFERLNTIILENALTVFLISKIYVFSPQELIFPKCVQRPHRPRYVVHRSNRRSLQS